VADNLKATTHVVLLLLASCASSQKPDLDLVLASAAIKAAERAEAEKKSPDLFNKAQNAFWKSKRFYLIKEYEAASKAAYEARRLAEKSELDATLKELSE
jgi:hypothetical protein